MSYASVPAGATCRSDEHCVTCGDTSVPVRVLRVDAERRLAECLIEADGTIETVDVWLVDGVGAGERLLVHAGTALDRLPGIEEETR